MRPRGLRASWRIVTRTYGYEPRQPARAAELAAALAGQEEDGGQATDISITVNDWGEFDPVDVDDLPVTGKDGDGSKTPTVRELVAILRALPDQFQDLPVTRYCDDGISGIRHEVCYRREEGAGQGQHTAHVSLW